MERSHALIFSFLFAFLAFPCLFFPFDAGDAAAPPSNVDDDGFVIVQLGKEAEEAVRKRDSFYSDSDEDSDGAGPDRKLCVHLSLSQSPVLFFLSLVSCLFLFHLSLS